MVLGLFIVLMVLALVCDTLADRLECLRDTEKSYIELSLRFAMIVLSVLAIALLLCFFDR